MAVRAYKWYTTHADFVALAGGVQTNANLLANLELANNKNATVTRIILSINVAPDTVAQQTATYFGITTVSAEALTAGALPEADVDTDAVDWMLRGFVVNRMSDLSDQSQTSWRHYDLKAQRVLRDARMRLALILDHSSGGGVFWSYMARVLVKLP